MSLKIPASLMCLGLMILECACDTQARKRFETKGSACNQEALDRSFVSQCGPAQCESIFDGVEKDRRVDDWPSSRHEIVHVVSSRENHRLKVIKSLAIDTDEFYYEENHVNVTLFVDLDTRYQRILGFGTTLTDATCKNVDDLPEAVRQRLIDDFFNPETGASLNLLRVPIGSTKYSYSNYVLDHDANQVELSPYDVDHRIPLIKDVLKAAGRLKNRVKIVASSNTAPAEMKQNNQMIHGGLLKQDKFDEYATYLTGFTTAYKSYGLRVWSLIVSVDPATNQIKGAHDELDYNSLSMRPSDAYKLIKSIRSAQSNEMDKFRILILGDSRGHIPVWSDALLRPEGIANEVVGIAYSCVKSDSSSHSYDNLAYAVKRHPNKYLLATQSASNTPVRLGDWQYGENYVTDIVRNLEFGSVGWIDFNMALNMRGGPSISNRFEAESAVLVDARLGIYYRNPSFYAIVHLSRYVKPGSIRVKLTLHTSPHMYASQQIAFLTPDNFLVVFVANNNIGPMPISIGYNKRTKIQALLETKSFNTFVMRL